MGLLVSSVIPKAVGFNYTQATTSDTWVITHNLNVTGGPVVDVSVDVSGTLTKIIPHSITVNSANQITIGFTKPYSGVARCV